MKTYLEDLTIEEIIKRLKSGQVIRWADNSDYYKFVDGVLCLFYNDGSFVVNATLNKDVEPYYFETEEPFEITGTGLYKTRDGRKAFVSYIDNEDCLYPVLGIIDGEEELTSWQRTGFISEARKYDREDILSKWED